MVILLEPEVFQEQIVATLVSAGHTVKCLQRHSEEYDFIFGPRACRIPGDPKHIDPDEAMKLIGVAVKSMESLARVQAKNEGKAKVITKKPTKPKTVKAKKNGKRTDNLDNPVGGTAADGNSQPTNTDPINPGEGTGVTIQIS